MKKVFAIITLLLCLATQAQNLAPNGSFENGPVATSIGWHYGVTFGCTNVGIVTGPVGWDSLNLTPDRLVLGTYFCLWDNNTAYDGFAWTVFGPEEAGGCILVSPLIAGQQYSMSLCVQSETLRGTVLKGSKLKFEFINPTGNTIITPLIDTTEWICFTLSFTATANSTYLKVTGLDKGTDFDNFSIVELNPLPVELFSFDAKHLCSSVVVMWSTASESNSDYFEVQRADSTGSFRTLVKVNGMGYASSLTNYNYQDTKPCTGISFYRLKQVDYNGKEYFSKTIEMRIRGRQNVNGILSNVLGQDVSPDQFLNDILNYKILPSQ